jgi:uncharacterized membrane protein YhaH (DUF805 family)
MLKCPKCGTSDWSTTPVEVATLAQYTAGASQSASSSHVLAVHTQTGPIAAVTVAIKKSAVFDGRASRSEYWYFTLFYLVVSLLLGFLMELTSERYGDSSVLSILFILAYIIFYLWVIVAGLAVQVRRLHDLNKSGWLALLMLVPIVGPIILLVWNCTRGTFGMNRFGPEPLYY